MADKSLTLAMTPERLSDPHLKQLHTTVSSPGSTGRPSIPETAAFMPRGRSVPDAPHEAGHDVGENSKPRSRGVDRPSFGKRTTLIKREGAGKAGYPLIPAVRVQKKARGRTTGSAKYRPSLRNGVTAASCSRRCAGLVGHRIATTRKRVALGISVGMPRPHDLTVHVRAARLAVQPRPSHPTPRVVTIAIRPSCRGGTGRYRHDF
jgi:hypothetical protein